MIATFFLSFNWTELLQPQFYIEHGGLWVLLFIVFVESGLIVGFFLPTDTFLFIAGVYSSDLILHYFPFIQNEYVQFSLLLFLTFIAGILGDACAYQFGKKVGATMYTWKDNIIFKQKNLEYVTDFYKKHGRVAVVVARFLPMVRTFSPVVAGIIQMERKKFIFYNAIGCFIWVSIMLVSGHFLQKWILNQFGFSLKDHLEIIILVIMLVTTVPILFKIFTGRGKK